MGSKRTRASVWASARTARSSARLRAWWVSASSTQPQDLAVCEHVEVGGALLVSAEALLRPHRGPESPYRPRLGIFRGPYGVSNLIRPH